MSEQKITSIDIARAATNDPAMASAKVILGDREFPIMDMPYEDNVKFLAYLQPLLESVAGRVAGVTGDSGLTSAGLLKYCAASLPEMACMVCKQSDQSITVDEVKRLGRSPIRLASVVAAQMQHDRTINDIVDFFKQMLPMLKLTNLGSK
jgi:hypothetical protein